MASLRKLSEIFDCSIDSLLSSKEENTPKVIEKVTEQTPVITAEKKPVYKCHECHKDIFENEKAHNITKKSETGINEMVTICDDCFLKQEEERKQRTLSIKKEKEEAKKEKEKHESKITFIWAIISGIIVLVITLIICIFNYKKIGIPLTIFLPLIIGYAITSDVYCIFTDTFISDIFMHIASFSIKFPRLIFTFNLEGFAWLIAMKLLFAAIGFIVGILVIILAVGVSSLFSIFVFIPAVIKDHKR